jgi:hypothetical protein
LALGIGIPRAVYGEPAQDDSPTHPTTLMRSSGIEPGMIGALVLCCLPYHDLLRR